MKRVVIGIGVAALAAGSGCKSESTSAAKNDTPAAVTAQIDRGAQVYGMNCAKCHGDAGEGAKAPPLVGKNALPLKREGAKKRTGEFHTAMDVAAFVTKNMPPDEEKRKAIPESDYWAVLAFDLNANGVKLTEPVTPQNASKIVLHP